MSDKYFERGIINIKDELYRDISSGQFNQFLFVTYTVDPELIEWFPPDSEVTVCIGNKESYEKMKNNGFSNRNVRFMLTDVHAKIYLMWNHEKIKCWFGSFNFSTRGLFESIEWAAFFEGKLVKEFTVYDVLDRDLTSQLTDNIVINQLLDLINSKLRKKDPSFCDNVFQNSSFEIVLLHTQGTNTLGRCISRVLSKANSDVKITYITPYMNKSGIINFCKLFESQIPLNEVEFRILTNRPEPSSYQEGMFLKSDDLRDLKRKFKEFILLKRKSRDGGTILRDGTEISDDFIHLKLIHISFTNTDGIEERHTIFTSANLTERAWKDGENLEIGLWVRDQAKNEVVSKFIENFMACFSEPDEDELKEIDKVIEDLERRKKTDDYWIEDFLKDRLTLDEESVKIKWSPHLPRIHEPICKLYMKNIITGERLEETVKLEKSGEYYIGKIKKLTSLRNNIVDYIEVLLKTDFDPPEKRIKSNYIREYLTQVSDGVIFRLKGDIGKEWDEIVINEEVYSLNDNIEIKIPNKNIHDISSISLRKLKSSAENVRVLIKLEGQQYFGRNFFIGSEASIDKLDGVGKLLKVVINVNDKLDPPFDVIKFTDHDSNPVDYIGFSKEDSNVIYYFKPTSKYKSLKAEVKAPYNSYFGNESIIIKLPNVGTKSETKLLDVLSSSRFHHELVGIEFQDESAIDKLISEDSKIRIKPDQKLLELFDINQFKYIYKEEALFYKCPKLCSIDDEITPSEPFLRISYWGVVEIKSKDRTIYLLTPKSSFIVRKNLVKELSIDDRRLFPLELPISKMKEDEPIGWIKIDQNDIKITNELHSNFKEKIQLEVLKNGKRLQLQELPVLRTGQAYYIPMFRGDINTTVDLIFIVKFKEDDSYLSNFSWAIQRKTYEIDYERKKKMGRVCIKEKNKKYMIQIKDETNANSSIPIKEAFVTSSILEDVSRERGLIRIKRNEVCLVPKRDMFIALKKFRRH
ncbi:hypothetical protein DRP04_03890 [Archaeoglobales archaeon]|nr:MAG: hypothetical protein DRP04_03890 [Archaeoglobales archaeon]